MYPFPLARPASLAAAGYHQPGAICRLALLVFLCAVAAPQFLAADEIDEVFNQPAPALYEQPLGEQGGCHWWLAHQCEQPFGEQAAPLQLVGHQSSEDQPSVTAPQLEAPPAPEDFDYEQSYAPACCFDFNSDLRGFLPMLRDDARSVINWNNTAILGGALATSLAFRQSLDERVRRNTAQHPERWSEGSRTLGKIGEVQYHVAAMAVLYGISLKRQDDELHDFTTTLVSAYTINGLSTLTLKGIANTERPSDKWNGGEFGFPSFHASSSFTIAAVVDEYYGPKAGLPAYALAGLISWSRIDERDHDLSDVFFGAAMGYVIGHAVAGRHLRCDSRVKLLPYIHPTEGTSGLMVDVSF